MKKLIYITGIDIFATFYFFVIDGIDELGVVYTTFTLICLSAITGILFLCFENTKDMGAILMWNVLIIPLTSALFVIVGDYWRYYKIYGDDIEYEIDYKSYHFEVVLHGEKFYRRMSSDNSMTWFNHFEIIQKKTEFGIGANGHYEKIGDNVFVLVKRPEHYRNVNCPDDILCKDTMLLSNDTLFNFFDKPISVKRKSLFD